MSEDEATTRVCTDATLNTSGKGKHGIAPDEVLFKRWNWGAFLFTWIWGIGNNTYVSFLVFVPVVGFIIPFLLATRGYEWAWRNRRWKSLEDFLDVQRKWANTGFGLLGVSALSALWLYAAWFYVPLTPLPENTQLRIELDRESIQRASAGAQGEISGMATNLADGWDVKDLFFVIGLFDRGNMLVGAGPNYVSSLKSCERGKRQEDEWNASGAFPGFEKVRQLQDDCFRDELMASALTWGTAMSWLAPKVEIFEEDIRKAASSMGVSLIADQAVIAAGARRDFRLEVVLLEGAKPVQWNALACWKWQKKPFGAVLPRCREVTRS